MRWSSGAKRLSAFQRPLTLQQGKLLTQLEGDPEMIIRCPSEICRRTLISLAVCRWLYGPIWIETSQFYRSLARAIWIKIPSILLITSQGNLNAKYCTCNNIQNRLVNVAMAGNMTQRISTGIHSGLPSMLWFCGFYSYSCPLSIPKFRKSYAFFNCAIFPDYICLVFDIERSNHKWLKTITNDYKEINPQICCKRQWLGVSDELGAGSLPGGRWPFFCDIS